MGLLRSVPRLDRPRGSKLETIEGLPPNLREPPARLPLCAALPVPHRDLRRRSRRCIRPTPAALSRCHRACRDRRRQAHLGGRVGGAGLKLAAKHRRAAAVGAQPDQAFRRVRGRLCAAPGGTVRAVRGRLVRRSIRARRSAWSANPAAARPRSAALILRLEEPTGGEIRFDGADLSRAPAAPTLKAMRRKIQVIFQDPYSSLNPRMTVGQIIGEPLHVYKLVAGPQGRARRASPSCSTQVGLRPEMAERYPHQLVRRPAPARRHRARAGDGAVLHRLRRGGVGARRLDPGPDHQPAGRPAARGSASPICSSRTTSRWCATSPTRVVVMYFGRIMEVADRDALYREPAASLHQGAARRRAGPRSDDREARASRALIKGELPSHLTPPTGCVFHTRCPMAERGMPARSSRRWKKSGRDISRPASRSRRRRIRGSDAKKSIQGGNA